MTQNCDPMKKLHTLLMFAFSVSLVLAFSPAATAVAQSPDMTYVYGTVYDTDTGLGIKGATVEALCIETGYTKSGPTKGNDGNYAINSLKCSIDHTVKVTAKKDGVIIGSNEGLVQVCNDQLSMCNSAVHVGVSEIKIGIPEFPLAILPAMLAMLSFGLVSRRF